jgi:hypothetical protein
LNEITPDKQRRLAQPSFVGQVSVLGAKARKVGARVFEIGDPQQKINKNSKIRRAITHATMRLALFT